MALTLSPAPAPAGRGEGAARGRQGLPRLQGARPARVGTARAWSWGARRAQPACRGAPGPGRAASPTAGKRGSSTRSSGYKTLRDGKTVGADYAQFCPGHPSGMPLPNSAVKCHSWLAGSSGNRGAEVGWTGGGREGGFSSPLMPAGCCLREGTPTGRAPVAAASGARRPPPGTSPASQAEAAGHTLGPRSGDGAHPKHKRTGARHGDRHPESQTDFVGWAQYGVFQKAEPGPERETWCPPLPSSRIS